MATIADPTTADRNQQTGTTTTTNSTNSTNSTDTTSRGAFMTTSPPAHARPDRARIRVVIIMALAAAFMLMTTSCGLLGSDAPAAGPDVTLVPTTEPGVEPSSQASLVDLAQPWVDASARAVVTGGAIDVSEEPGGPARLTLDPTTSFGTPRVLLVEEERDGWLKVRLPMRPNHRSGWIPADRADVEALDIAIDIDLAARTLSVNHDGRTLLSTPVAIGTTDNPTPTGTFFVTDKLETPEPSGAYGPFALGLSGYSETLTEFAGGDGQIGIHGTDDPGSIGRDASHGCVRVPNDIIEQLAELLPLGTPVHIR